MNANKISKEKFVLEVESTEFVVEKSVLAEHSEFFKAMFRAKESIESQRNRVKFKEISQQTMTSLVNYFHSQKIELDELNVVDILTAAHRLQILEIVQICVSFMIKELNTDNCLLFAAVACHLTDLQELFKPCLEKCAQNFSRIVKQEEFLLVDISLLIHLVSSEDIEDESQVVVAIET